MSGLRTLCPFLFRFSREHPVHVLAFSSRLGLDSGQKRIFLAFAEIPWQVRGLTPLPPRNTEGIVLQVPEHVRKTYSPDGGIVLDVQHGRMFTLNLIGSKILELLDRQYTVAQIAAELSREYGIDAGMAARDVREFLDLLEKHRLIETHPGVAL